VLFESAASSRPKPFFCCARGGSNCFSTSAEALLKEPLEVAPGPSEPGKPCSSSALHRHGRNRFSTAPGAGSNCHATGAEALISLRSEGCSGLSEPGKPCSSSALSCHGRNRFSTAPGPGFRLRFRRRRSAGFVAVRRLSPRLSRRNRTTLETCVPSFEAPASGIVCSRMWLNHRLNSSMGLCPLPPQHHPTTVAAPRKRGLPTLSTRAHRLLGTTGRGTPPVMRSAQQAARAASRWEAPRASAVSRITRGFSVSQPMRGQLRFRLQRTPRCCTPEGMRRRSAILGRSPVTRMPPWTYAGRVPTSPPRLSPAFQQCR